MERRRAILESKSLLTHIHFDGASHHLHIDPTYRAAVAEHIIGFFNGENSSTVV